MKMIYSTPSTVAMNVEVENTILAGSPYQGQGAVNGQWFNYVDGQGNEQRYMFFQGLYYPGTLQADGTWHYDMSAGVDQLPWVVG